ncbi:type II secretion system F family protein [Streptomyces sp. TE5632]
MSTPPKPGKALSVKVDAYLYDDLAVMLRTGMTLSDAVRHAVRIVADGYRGAWESGRIPDGVAPDITHVMVRRYDAGQRPSDALGEGPSDGVPYAGHTQAGAGHTGGDEGGMTPSRRALQP